MGNCEICNPLETVEHVLFGCTKYSNQRLALRNGLEKVGIKQMEISNIFSNNSGKLVLKNMPYYLQQTGLTLGFKQM